MRTCYSQRVIASQGKKVDLHKAKDEHVVSTLLKRFLRKLPVPLLPKSFTNQTLRWKGKPSSVSAFRIAPLPNSNTIDWHFLVWRCIYLTCYISCDFFCFLPLFLLDEQPEVRAIKVKELVKGLPEDVCVPIEYVFRFLYKVKAQESFTKMSSAALGIVFGKLLF